MRNGTKFVPFFGDAEKAVSSMLPYRNFQSKAGFKVRQKALSVALYLISFGGRYSELAARGIHAGSTSQLSFNSPDNAVDATTINIKSNLSISLFL